MILNMILVCTTEDKCAIFCFLVQWFPTLVAENTQHGKLLFTYLKTADLTEMSVSDKGDLHIVYGGIAEPGLGITAVIYVWLYVQ